ncbi:MAG: NAD(P)/FAD-dependent oxidoreductase [Burkholderiaceae bacterium]|jgi:NADPH-dependent 2,4-dienoyl-CoA reductase/sulfur reductase-like enzyme|nr:NAD(P)/FAD-dependent oxidoreductase [Burkholderiaceae bacterium]
MNRRSLVRSGLALGLASSIGSFARASTGSPSIVVVGGGFGGATFIRYLRRWLPSAKITLIEPSSSFIMCPLSNRVLTGGLPIKTITQPYRGFVARQDVRWVNAAATDIDTDRREVVAGRERVSYDRLVVAPGVEFVYESLQGLQTPQQQFMVPHAWRAGEQTIRLRNMLQAMPDNGVVAMHIPKVPYRCPPGPYERASLIASYLELSKPKAKLLVFDSNTEVQSKKGLFESVWKQRYSKHIQYVPDAELTSVDANSGTLNFSMQGSVKADVINVIPPQRAGAFARNAGLASVRDRWCGVDFLTYESTARKGIHVLGDSIMAAPSMPKSGHMANQHAKVCAAAIASEYSGLPVPDNPILANTCYSFVSQREVIHVAHVFRYDAEKKTMVQPPGSGGLSDAPSTVEAIWAMAWATNIMNDTLGT